MRRLFFLTGYILSTGFLFAQRPLADSVVVPAGLQYGHPAPLKRFFLGRNYRTEWMEPISMPVFHLKGSGFTVEKTGGGMQTKSIQLQDKFGKEWALRTVDKDAKGALPPKAQQNKFMVKVIQDLISASFPYASLVVPELAMAMNVPTAHPRLFYVPLQNDLGKYDTLLAGKVCTLEERDLLAKKISDYSTNEVLKLLNKSNSYTVDQESVLKARLLDMLVADWDRHEDQYKWYLQKKEGINTFFVIPKDRDQAFYRSNGWLSKILTLFVMKWTKGFTDNLNNIKNINYKAQLFDARFLNALDKSQWQQLIEQAQKQLTDSVIHKAVLGMPGPVYLTRGAEFEKKLIQRRNDLLKEGLRYYKQLSVVVKVEGTADAERFVVTTDKNRVWLLGYKKDQEKPFYERSFDPAETKIVEIHGWGGADQFDVQGINMGVRLKLYGGSGSDRYDLKGTIKKLVVDDESNNYVQLDRTRKRTVRYRNPI